MWKLLLSLVLLAALGAGAYRYFYPEEARRLLADTPLEKPSGTTRPLYQWKDNNGQWQVTDAPPPAGTPYEVKRYPIDANVLPMSGLLKKSP
jgi:hypothetical protein